MKPINSASYKTQLSARAATLRANRVTEGSDSVPSLYLALQGWLLSQSHYATDTFVALTMQKIHSPCRCAKSTFIVQITGTNVQSKREILEIRPIQTIIYHTFAISGCRFWMQLHYSRDMKTKSRPHSRMDALIAEQVRTRFCECRKARFSPVHIAKA